MSSLLRGSLTLLSGSLVAQALPLALGPWLTRVYTPEQFGQFAMFASIAANMAVVACARYELALPMAVDAAEQRSLMSICIRLLLTVTGASCCAALVLLGTGQAHEWLLLPLAVLVLGALQWLVMQAINQGYLATVSISRIAQYGGGALLQLAFGFIPLGALGLMLGPILAGAIAAALLLQRPPKPGWQTLLSAGRAEMLQAARKYRDFPLFNAPHVFLGALQDTLALALISWVAGPTTAGYWMLVVRYLKAPATLVGSAVAQTLYPRLARTDGPQGWIEVKQAALALALLAAPLVTILLLAGPAMFAFVFGERWRDAGDLAQALAVYIGFHFVASPLASVTAAWRVQAWALKCSIVGQIVFLLSLGVGLKLGGLTGAGWALSISMPFYFSYFYLALPRLQRLHSQET